MNALRTDTRPHTLMRHLACTLCLLGLILLSGCAGTRSFDEANALFAQGRHEEGFAKLEEAAKRSPSNAQYRIMLVTQRASLVGRQLAAGESAYRENRFSDAEKAWNSVLGLEPDNAIARQGLRELERKRRHLQWVAEAEALFAKGGSTALAQALEKLRPVLAENPSHKEALNLKARIDEQRAREARPETRLAETFKKSVSLEFRDAPFKSVLEVVSKLSGLNFFYDREIRPDLKVTIFARNTSIEDAMRVILLTNQLEYKVLNENSLLIYPGTPQKLKEYQTLAVRSFFLTNADVKAVANSIKTIVKTRDVVVDERLGMILVRDTPEAIRMAERIVTLQDLSDPEVMLEVEVLEFKRSRLLELGIQWPGQLGLSPLSAAGQPITLQTLRNLDAATTQANVGSLLLNARKEDQNGNTLANPRIRVRNKEKAKIQIGDRVPVITTTSTSTGFVSESINYVDVGLKLEVEPVIHLNDEVGIKLNLEVSNLVREVLSKSGALSYQIGSRGATTVLRLKDGETQILAGLISDEDRSTANRVPLLGDLPVAGRLFGSQKDDTQRSEILLSITPRVVRSLRRPDLLEAEFDSGTESSVGSAPLRLATAVPEAGGAPFAPGPGATPDGGAAAVSPALAALPVKPEPSLGTTSQSTPWQGAGADPALAPPPALDPASVTPAAPPQAQARVPATPPSAAPAPLSFKWQVPAEVKAGEQFSAVLQLSSEPALTGLPILLGYDPQLLQVVGVQEGDFFRQGRGKSSFTHRIDPVQGKVFAALVREGDGNAGVNGLGAVLTVVLKAVKASPAAKIRLLSATPEPLPDRIPPMPLDQTVRVLP